MTTRLYDNFLRAGAYSEEDVRLRLGTDGKTAADAIRDRLYLHRSNPERNPMGARFYRDVKTAHPSSKNKLNIATAAPDGQAMRASLASLIAANSGTMMRSRGALVACIQGIRRDSVLHVELDSISGFFFRLNPRNDAMLADCRAIMEWFADINLRGEWPAHHEALLQHLDMCVVEVVSKTNILKYCCLSFSEILLSIILSKFCCILFFVGFCGGGRSVS